MSLRLTSRQMLSKWDMKVYGKCENTDKIRLFLSFSSKCSVSLFVFVILFFQVPNQSPAVPARAGAAVPPDG